MNRITNVSVGAGLLALLSLSATGEVPHEHGHTMIKERTLADNRQDERVALGLDQAAEAGMKLTMREHLEALQDIVASLGREKFDQAARVAHEELGFPKHHRAMQREGGATFPSKYHELAMAHHQEAEDLAEAIPSKNLNRILPQLERTIGACVACHRAFKS